MIDVFQQHTLVFHIIGGIGFLCQQFVHVREDHRVENAVHVFGTALQAGIGLFDAEEGIVEAHVEVDVLHQPSDAHQMTDIIVEDTLVDRPPESE